MKDRSLELRRVGRRYSSRVHQGIRDRLSDEWSRNEGAVCARKARPKAAMHVLSERNWRVRRLNTNEVVAIEPGWEYETPFEGPDAFWAAVEFAAEELKKDHGD